MSTPPALTNPALRALLVDDEDALRRVFRKVFALDRRLDVVADARDGHEAVDRARDHQPSVILLDVRMPGMDGFEALPLIRAVAPAATIIMLSMMQDPKSAERAFSLGADGFVDKTTEPGPLVDEVLRIHAERAAAAATRAAVAHL